VADDALDLLALWVREPWDPTDRDAVPRVRVQGERRLRNPNGKEGHHTLKQNAPAWRTPPGAWPRT